MQRMQACCRRNINLPHWCSILAGIAAAAGDTRYILCLDDDIVLHPGTLAALVAGLAANDDCFMATGLLAAVGCHYPCLLKRACVPA